MSFVSTTSLALVLTASAVPGLPPPSSCPPARACVDASLEQLLDNAVYTPQHETLHASLGALTDAGPVSLAFCVEPDTGKTSSVRITGLELRGAAARARALEIVTTIQRWRIRPLERGGEARLACTVISASPLPPAPEPEAPSPPARTPAPTAFIPAMAIYTPGPQRAWLRTTPSAHTPRAIDRTSELSFCVTTAGKTDRIKTVRRSGDPELDAQLRQLVRKWRFKPAILGGRPVESCGVQRFHLRFAPKHSQPSTSTLLHDPLY